MSDVVTIHASSAARRGDALALWARVISRNPEAVILRMDSLLDVDPWLEVIKPWRAGIDAAAIQPAILLQLIPGDKSLLCPETMVRALDSGIDDLVVAKNHAPELQARLVQAMRFRAMTHQLRTSNRELTNLSYTDELTGLLNMRAFKPQLVSASQLCGDGKFGMAVVMMDIDYFKLVNDRNNHLVGSDILQAVGNVLRPWNNGELTENFSRASRYGGDEFVMCFSVESAVEACMRIDNLRKAVANQTFLSHGRVVHLTASFGISWCPAGKSIDSAKMLQAADVMLYRSKADGRNRVTAVDLGNPVDLDHVRRSDLVDWNAGRNDDRFTRVDQAKIFKKVG